VVNKFFDTENRIQVIIEIIQQLNHLNEGLLTAKNKTLLHQIKSGKLENLAIEDTDNKQNEELIN
jgi:uncharacterized protein YfkK (UPF0435 family)